MTVDPLERRLRQLAEDAPDPGRLTVLALGRGTARRWPRIALSSVMALALVVLVAYFAPATNTVVARVPLAGDLVGASERVTVVGSTATSSGYTVTLVAAYADTTRTELRFHVSPASSLGFGIEMTDQFGRSYGVTSSFANLQTGDVTAELQPLAWPDPLAGARIDIHIAQLQAGPDINRAVKGTWTLHATIGVDEGTSLAPPAPVTLGHARLTFKSVVVTPASIAIDVDISGVSLADLETHAPDSANAKGSRVFTLDILDETGNSVLATDSESQDWLGPIHVRLLSYARTPGTYTVVASYNGQRETRSITVP